jgi:c-di-GMP-binding flagellar brake protein YcgR
MLDSRIVDFSHLVGREIKIRTEQFPDRVLTTRIISIKEKNLVLDRGGEGGLIDQLVHRQKVQVSFDYRGQPVTFHSQILAHNESKIAIPIASKVAPQLRRKYIRFDLEKEIRLTYFDPARISSARLNKLKWLETPSINISGGGVLVRLPQRLNTDNYIVLNMDMGDFELPRLMVGRVRHCMNANKSGSLVGVEFVVKEKCSEILPAELIKSLSPSFFDFNQKIRDDMARFLEKVYKNNIK